MSDIATAQQAVDAAQTEAQAAYQAWQDAQGRVQAAQYVLDQAKTELSAQIQAGQAGAYSSIDQALQKERFAGKAAVIDFLKANPGATEDQAVAAWTPAAIAATGLPACIVPPANYLDLFTSDLHNQGLIPDLTWGSLVAWVVATDKETIMAN
jgi:hypothetical protein